MGDFGLFDVEFVCLDGVVEGDVVLLVEGSVLQIHNSRANEVIAQYGIIVPHLNLQNRILRQLHHLINLLIELRIIAILNILIHILYNIVTKNLH